MARVSSAGSERVYSIKGWLGVNECPDGDTQLKAGEAAEMRNFRVTRDGNLQKRPGMRKIHLSRAWEGPIRGVWHGFVGGCERTVFAAGGGLWEYDFSSGAAAPILRPGVEFGDSETFFFGFSGRLYALNGHQYIEWDGSTPPEGGAAPVAGYRPLIAVSAPPSGGGTPLEAPNRLCGQRRVRFSPTGSAYAFQLPETGLSSVDYVKNLVTGAYFAPDADYTADLENGRVLFATLSEGFTGDGSTKIFLLANRKIICGVARVTVGGVQATAFAYNPATGVLSLETAPASGAPVVVTEVKNPPEGTNTIEIGYTHPKTNRSSVEAMRFAEIYGGSTDSRVFLYGDGSNAALYSGLDESGAARADYFPDLNVLAVGAANTPLTALIRHYSQLDAFKTDGAFTISCGTVSLADGGTAAAFYVIPVNRSIGCTAMGQAQLVMNSPRTLFNSAVYEWKSSSAYAYSLTADERQAKLISGRVHATLREMGLAGAWTFDDNERQEYYVARGKTAVVHNYAADAWYVYTGFDVTRLFTAGGQLYGCTSAGDIVHISPEYRSDDGEAIDCYWRSGSMSFGGGWLKKCAPKAYITLKPELGAYIQVRVRTSSRGDCGERAVKYGLSSFRRAHFAHLSFGTNRRPQTVRLGLRADKFKYLQLILESSTDWSAATILAAEIRVRYTGDIG